MKKILIVLLTFLPALLIAQSTQGIIVYEEKIENDIESDMTDEEKAQLAQFGDFLEQLKNMTTEKQLLFNENTSVYKEYKATDNKQVMGSEEGDFQIVTMMISPEEIIFQDYRNEKVVEQKEFMEKKFLLNYEMKSSQWKITGDQKEILGYTCHKAILNDTSDVVAAWFTMQIPIPSGPSIFGQLPGMILEVSLNEGKMIYLAKSVEFKDIDSEEIVAPKKGKEVTEEEFEKIVLEKTKEMEEMYGKEGGHRIEIHIGE